VFATALKILLSLLNDNFPFLYHVYFKNPIASWTWNISSNKS